MNREGNRECNVDFGHELLRYLVILENDFAQTDSLLELLLPLGSRVGRFGKKLIVAANTTGVIDATGINKAMINSFCCLFVLVIHV